MSSILYALRLIRVSWIAQSIGLSTSKRSISNLLKNCRESRYAPSSRRTAQQFYCPAAEPLLHPASDSSYKACHTFQQGSSPRNEPRQLAEPIKVRGPFHMIPAGSSLFLRTLKNWLSHLLQHRNLPTMVMEMQNPMVSQIHQI